MTGHLLHAGTWELIGWSAAVFALVLAVVTAVWTGGGVAARWLAGRVRRIVRRRQLSRAAHRHAHRARRPRPRLAALLAATHLTRYIPGGTQ